MSNILNVCIKLIVFVLVLIQKSRVANWKKTEKNIENMFKVYEFDQ